MADGTVLLRRGALGDVVLLGAVTAAVPGPVTVVTDPRWAEVAGRLRGVDAVVPWGEALPPGRVVDLQGSRRSRALAPGADRIRKRSVARRLRLWLGVGPVRPPVPELYGEACGVSPAPLPWIDLPDVQRDTLVLVPGAAWEPKRWRTERLAAVAEGWERVVVLGGPGEEALCAAVARDVSGAEVLCERGFGRTLDLLARARVVVAGDTGLMHLAGACGAPVVAIFGPTHPDDGFFVYPGEVVQRELSCRPCTLHRIRSCPQGDHACMEIPAADVAAAVARCAG